MQKPTGELLHRHHLVDVGDVHPAGCSAGGEALDVLHLVTGLVAPSGETLDEFVAVVDVEDEHSDAAPLRVVADSGTRNI